MENEVSSRDEEVRKQRGNANGRKKKTRIAFAHSLPQGFIVVRRPLRSGYPNALSLSRLLFTFSLPLSLSAFQLPITPPVLGHDAHQPWGTPRVFPQLKG